MQQSKRQQRKAARASKTDKSYSQWNTRKWLSKNL